MKYLDPSGLFYYDGSGQQQSSSSASSGNSSSGNNSTPTPNISGPPQSPTPQVPDTSAMPGMFGENTEYYSFTFKLDLEPLYDYKGNFIGFGEDGRQRADAIEQTRLFYFQFEGRNKRNVITESFTEILCASREENGNWTLLDYSMSVLHQNGIGSDELKFISKDGREAVFTKDFSKDGSYELYTDPRYMGTYNYCNPAPLPQGITDVKGIVNYIGKSLIGHGCLDVIPYLVSGKRNVRDYSIIVK